VTEHQPYIDFENLPAPSEGFIVTLTLRVATRHRGYTHTVFTFFANAAADLIRTVMAESADTETARL
jgi:hypothetical protein